MTIIHLFAVYLMILGAIGNLIWAFAGNVLKQFCTIHYKTTLLWLFLYGALCALWEFYKKQNRHVCENLFAILLHTRRFFGF